jgi:Na+/H+ antiporter NhaD/arsenite permease-like protein
MDESVRAMGCSLPLWAVLPFAGILLSIAIFPIFMPRFWHHHFGKVSAFWSLLFVIPFLCVYRDIALYEILETMLIDYLPFIILLWGLSVISGGVVLRSSIQGKPLSNTTMLLIGTILASLIGTMGASIVMIRPVLRANKLREKKAHIVCFFIFLVANIGGALTPVGPPLFLGYLHMVPFFWVTRHLLPPMLLVTAVLLALFYFIDPHLFSKEQIMMPAAPETAGMAFRIEGSFNIVLLAGVVGIILISGYWQSGFVSIMGVEMYIRNSVRDGTIIALGLASLIATPEKLRDDNEFSWLPLIEVAKLFAAIFVTIIPALAILKAGPEGALASLFTTITTPADYFWASGWLSSFLDNAPTYLTFFNMVLAKFGVSEAAIPVALMSDTHVSSPLIAHYLEAVSAGAVFMGANTYIGNAPNFLVKSIVEEAGVSIPSFFSYMFKYSIPILTPIYIVIAYLFF